MNATPVLMSAENPNGWKLEDLLAVLRHEVEQKTQRIINDDSEVAQQVRINNYRIMACLSEAHLLQVASYQLLAEKVGPNPGPLGKARIG